MILKQIDHPKMKILSSFNHPPKLVPKLYEFLSCATMLQYKTKYICCVLCIHSMLHNGGGKEL